MRALVLCALAACGRIGFDDSLDCSATRVAGVPYANSSEGADGATTPFLICTADQLDAISQHPEHWGSAFRLADDLELASRAASIGMIGDDTTPFTGTFDGGGHTVFDLAYDLPSKTEVGLFAVAGTGARITDLMLATVNVRGYQQVGALIGVGGGITVERFAVSGVVAGDREVGGVIGLAQCDPSMCQISLADVRADVDVTATSGLAGGILGSTYSDRAPAMLTRVVSSGAVRGSAYVGGLVGDLERATIAASSSSADVNANGVAGGLVGISVYVNTTIDDSSSSGAVTCDAECGGAVGEATDGSITRTHATGQVMCTGDECGGLVGFAMVGPITGSYATGMVSGRDAIGGLVGESSDGILVADSFATGTIQGRNQVGGLLGHMIGAQTITRSYSVSSVTGMDDVGGVIGYVDSPTSPAVVTDNFFAGQVTGASALNLVAPLIGDYNGMVSTSGNAYSPGCTNTLGTCSPSGQPVADAMYFFSSANQPLTRWDFTTVWQEVPNTFPTHRIP